MTLRSIARGSQQWRGSSAVQRCPREPTQLPQPYRHWPCQQPPTAARSHCTASAARDQCAAATACMTMAAGIPWRLGYECGSGAYGRSGCSGQSVLGGSCRRWSWCCTGESTAATGCRRLCGPSAAQSASIPNVHPVRAASSQPPSRVASACRGALACMRPSPCSAAHTGPCSRTLLAPAVPTRPSAPGPTPPSVRML